jgi:hypothetical protein
MPPAIGSRPPFDVAGARDRLARAPETVSALCGGLPDRLWDVNEGAGTWSPREILCHLAHAEDDDWIPRMRLILESGRTKSFPPFERERGMAAYGALPAGRLPGLFAEKRAASLATFDAWTIGIAALQKEGKHPEFGIVTLEQLLATWVTHDHAHVVQIARVLEKYFGRWAGPWRAYFSALRSEGAVE